MIAVDQYIITPDHGDWAIRYNGDCLGRFASCPRAIRAAVEVAEPPPHRTTSAKLSSNARARVASAGFIAEHFDHEARVALN